MSNLRQIGVGLTQYLQDSDEVLACSWYASDGNVGNSTAPGSLLERWKWMDAIFPYVKSEQLFSCPSHSTSERYQFRNSNKYGSYSINSAYYNSGDAYVSPGGECGTSLLDIESPTTTVWVMDGLANSYVFAWRAPVDNPSFQITAGRPAITCSTIYCGGMAQLRHLDSSGVLFVDGHVKALTGDKLTSTHSVGGNSILSSFTIADD